MIDWTKPVHMINSHMLLRVLCTDAPSKWPVVLMFEDGTIWQTKLDGTSYHKDRPDVENVPPPKKSRTLDLVMIKHKGGSVSTHAVSPGWKVPNGCTVLAIQTGITITEGEGM